MIASDVIPETIPDLNMDEWQSVRSALLVAEAAARVRAMKANKEGTPRDYRNALHDVSRFAKIRAKMEAVINFKIQ